MNPSGFHPPKPQQGLKKLPPAQTGFETARHLGYLLTQRYVCHLRTALAAVGHSATRVLPEHVLEGLLVTSSAGSFKNCNPNLPPTKREMMIEDDSILILGPKDENPYAFWSSKWPPNPLKFTQYPWSSPGKPGRSSWQSWETYPWHSLWPQSKGTAAGGLFAYTNPPQIKVGG